MRIASIGSTRKATLFFLRFHTIMQRVTLASGAASAIFARCGPITRPRQPKHGAPTHTQTTTNSHTQPPSILVPLEKSLFSKEAFCLCSLPRLIAIRVCVLSLLSNLIHWSSRMLAKKTSNTYIHQPVAFESTLGCKVTST